jgi:hypothetical protein
VDAELQGQSGVHIKGTECRQLDPSGRWHATPGRALGLSLSFVILAQVSTPSVTTTVVSSTRCSVSQACNTLTLSFVWFLRSAAGICLLR